MASAFYCGHNAATSSSMEQLISHLEKSSVSTFPFVDWSKLNSCIWLCMFVFSIDKFRRFGSWMPPGSEVITVGRTRWPVRWVILKFTMLGFDNNRSHTFSFSVSMLSRWIWVQNWQCFATTFICLSDTCGWENRTDRILSCFSKASKLLLGFTLRLNGVFTAKKQPRKTFSVEFRAVRRI